MRGRALALLSLQLLGGCEDRTATPPAGGLEIVAVLGESTCGEPDPSLQLTSASVDVLPAVFAEWQFFYFVQIRNNSASEDAALEVLDLDIAYEASADPTGDEAKFEALVSAWGYIRFPFAGEVAPGESIFPGVPLPSSMLSSFADALSPEEPGGPFTRVVVSLRAHGMLGSKGVESNVLDFPIDICNGCLTYDCDDPAALDVPNPCTACCRQSTHLVCPNPDAL